MTLSLVLLLLSSLFSLVLSSPLPIYGISKSFSVLVATGRAIPASNAAIIPCPNFNPGTNLIVYMSNSGQYNSGAACGWTTWISNLDTVDSYGKPRNQIAAQVAGLCQSCSGNDIALSSQSFKDLTKGLGSPQSSHVQWGFLFVKQREKE